MGDGRPGYGNLGTGTPVVRDSTVPVTVTRASGIHARVDAVFADDDGTAVLDGRFPLSFRLAN